MITTIITSVNYNEFLEFLLPKNMSHFDDIIVLTVESDVECKRICDEYENVRCLVFGDDILKKNGRTFNKGALINKGLEYLDSINYRDWLTFLDSDVLLPDNFKELVEKLDKELPSLNLK